MTFAVGRLSIWILVQMNRSTFFFFFYRLIVLLPCLRRCSVHSHFLSNSEHREGDCWLTELFEWGRGCEWLRVNGCLKKKEWNQNTSSLERQFLQRMCWNAVFLKNQQYSSAAVGFDTNYGNQHGGLCTLSHSWCKEQKWLISTHL